MRVWRIFDGGSAYARAAGFDPFDGNGGLTTPGRWHHAGERMSYASVNASLALLEVLAAHEEGDMAEPSLVAADVPSDAIERVTRAFVLQLLRDASADDPEGPTRDFGTRWLREGRSLALVVPSVVMPHDRNVMINPAHARRAELRVVCWEQVRLDARLRRG
jgi:RES domain-containing protein